MDKTAPKMVEPALRKMLCGGFTINRLNILKKMKMIYPSFIRCLNKNMEGWTDFSNS